MNILKKSLIILFSVLLIAGACKNSSKSDNSFTVEEYVKAGMPDPYKVWAYDDYLNAYFTLDNFRILNPFSYPLKNSRKSGPIFSRLINQENLTFLNNPETSLYEKAFLIQDFAEFHNKMIGLYAENSESAIYYNEELIDIYLFALYVNDQMLDLSVKINNSTDQSDITLQSGQPTIIISYMNLISKLLEEQLKNTVYLSTDLERFSLEISQSLTKNFTLFKSDYSQSLATYLQEIIEKTPSDLIKDNYQKTLEAFKNE